MDFSDISLIKNELIQSSHTFVFEDISDRFLVNDTVFPEVCNIIENDPNFIFSTDNEKGEKRFISKNSLYNWFAKLNIKLAISKVFTLNESQLLSQMNSLCLNGSWSSIPIEYINFGQNLGLIYRLKEQGKYNFPISYAMSFFSPSSIQAAREYLFNRIYYDDITPQFEQLILDRLQDVLTHLTSRQQHVIIRRQGVLGFSRMKLEEIGQQLQPQVTRERVRQIENKCWNKIRHSLFQQRFGPLLLIYILNRKGSLLIFSSNIQREMEFICKCLNVPLWTFPYTKIIGIGDVNISMNFPENFWKDLTDLSTRIEDFLCSLPLQLIQEDVYKLAEVLAPAIIRRLTKSQKAYLALKQIGRPAHFSEVADMYIDMFPGEHPSEHSIHAILLREQHGIVWTGSKGKFALEEWGYERPPISIHDAVAEIVIQKYQATSNPVRLNVIQAEIGRYRKFVNPNSIMIAAYCNSRLTNVYNDYFVTKEADATSEADTNRLDQILKDFEEKTKGS